jgi:hypothetical protein
MDVVIFAALPFVTDKESRAPIGCAAQIRLTDPERSAEKESFAANITFPVFPHARWNRAPSPSLPTKLNLISRPRRQLVTLALKLAA